MINPFFICYHKICCFFFIFYDNNFLILHLYVLSLIVLISGKFCVCVAFSDCIEPLQIQSYLIIIIKAW